MKPIELNYIEKNGLLYPDIQISNDPNVDKQPIGKYGMMWLRFMKEGNYDLYIHHQIDGNLIEISHNINDEAQKMIDNFIGKSKNTMSMLIAEETVIKEFVLISR